MDTREVRIGNWVMGNAPYQVNLNQMVTNDMYLKQGKEPYFTPIKLTEEWLIKSGCIKLKNNMFRMGALTFQGHTDLTKLLVYGEKNHTGFRVCFCGKFIRNIFTVHDWQNFYHGISGLELTIK